MNSSLKRILKIYIIVTVLFFLIFTSIEIVIFLSSPIPLFFPSLSGSTDISNPSTTFDSQDNIFIVYEMNSKISYQISLDSGLSWSGQSYIPRVASSSQSCPAITVDEEDSIFITYIEKNTSRAQISLISSNDTGATFSPAKPILTWPSPDFGIYSIGDIAVSSDGMVFIVFRNSSLYLIEYNLTAEITSPPKIILESYFGYSKASMTLASNDTLFLTFFNNTDSFLYVMNSSNKGVSWSPSLRISNETIPLYGGPIISTNNQGDLLVFYQTEEILSGKITEQIVVQKSFDNGETWPSRGVLNTASDDRITPVLSVAVDSQNNYFIAWVADWTIFLTPRFTIEYLWHVRNLFSDVNLTIYFWNFGLFFGLTSGGYFIIALIIWKIRFSQKAIESEEKEE